MYGKHFESMYEGSMYGAGVAVFAVWGYVISHTHEGAVELNPTKLKDTLGAKNELEIVSAIKKLTEPDSRSRWKEHSGRRLLKEGEFQYRVVSWDHYQALKSAEDLREYNRLAKRRERAKKAGMSADEALAYEAGKRSERAKQRPQKTGGKPGKTIEQSMADAKSEGKMINHALKPMPNADVSDIQPATEEQDYPF